MLLGNNPIIVKEIEETFEGKLDENNIYIPIVEPKLSLSESFEKLANRVWGIERSLEDRVFIRDYLR